MATVTTLIFNATTATGERVELTAEEISALEAAREAAEREYWRTVIYDDAVNAKIRERYTESQEFAILRQRDEKPDDYAIYYTYCEECKAFVKEQMAKYAEYETIAIIDGLD